MTRTSIALVLATSLASCGPSAPAVESVAEVASPLASVPALPNKNIFSGALANATLEATRASLAGSPEGLNFSAGGDDPNIVIIPASAIDTHAVTKIVVTFRKIDLQAGEFSLFYRTADRDYDPRHFSYATSWEDLSPSDVRLTFDFSKAADAWAVAPVTQLRFDPMPGPTGKILILSISAES